MLKGLVADLRIFSISLVKWIATVSRICGDILPDKPAAA